MYVHTYKYICNINTLAPFPPTTPSNDPVAFVRHRSNVVARTRHSWNNIQRDDLQRLGVALLIARCIISTCVTCKIYDNRLQICVRVPVCGFYGGFHGKRSCWLAYCAWLMKTLTLRWWEPSRSSTNCEYAKKKQEAFWRNKRRGKSEWWYSVAKKLINCTDSSLRGADWFRARVRNVRICKDIVYILLFYCFLFYLSKYTILSCEIRFFQLGIYRVYNREKYIYLFYTLIQKLFTLR